MIRHRCVGSLPGHAVHWVALLPIVVHEIGVVIRSHTCVVSVSRNAAIDENDEVKEPRREVRQLGTLSRVMTEVMAPKRNIPTLEGNRMQSQQTTH